jgi:YtcA family
MATRLDIPAKTFEDFTRVQDFGLPGICTLVWSTRALVVGRTMAADDSLSISTSLVSALGFRRLSPTEVGNGRRIRAGRRRRSADALWRVAIAVALCGCSYSPTQDLFGSYFPAWMLCAAVGVVASIILRQVLVVSGINDYVVAPLLTYAGLAVSATLLAWLVWFGH